MKKSLPKSSLSTKFERFLEENRQFQLISKDIIPLPIHLYTRYDKIHNVLTKIKESDHSVLETTDQLPTIFKFTGNSKKIDTFTNRLTHELSNLDQFKIYRSFHDGLLLEEIELANDEIGLNSGKIIELNVLKDSRNFESIFRKLNQRGYKFVAINIELLKKGHVVLANKFDLDVVAIGVKHERHLDILSLSNTKYFLLAET